MSLKKYNIKEIKEVWAYVSVDPKDNTEGIVAMIVPGNGTIMQMPMIAADKERFDLLKPHAEEIAQEAKKNKRGKIRLIKLSKREVIKEDILS